MYARFTHFGCKTRRILTYNGRAQFVPLLMTVGEYNIYEIKRRISDAHLRPPFLPCIISKMCLRVLLFTLPTACAGVSNQRQRGK